MAKTTRIKLLTPFGRASYCALIRPSTKFNPDGDYSARILLEPGAETDAFIARLQELYEESYQLALAEVRKDKPKVESVKRADPPFRHPEDPDTGAQMPGWQIGAKLKAVARDKNKQVVGTRRPIVVDATGSGKVTEEVGPGSELRLQVEVSPFFTAALGAGLSLRLLGAQVRKHVALGMGAVDFDAVDGEYTVQPSSTAPDRGAVQPAPEAPTESTEAASADGEW